MSIRSYMRTSSRPGSRVDALYSIPLDGLGEAELEDERKILTLQPRTNFGNAAASFPVFREAAGRLFVPRFYGLQRFGAPEADERSEGVPVRLDFRTPLRPVQQQAFDAVMRTAFAPAGSGGAIVVLPCGQGKTVLSFSLAAALGRKTAVLVHTSVLRTQWRCALEEFCPGVRVGCVQGPVFEVADCDVVIMMVQTVARRQFAFDVTDEFGLVVCDEAHHMAAPTMNQALGCFRAKYVLALTATKERADGLTRLLHWSLGAEAFRAERKEQKVTVYVVQYEGAAVHKTAKDGRALVAVMLNLLSAHAGRNAFLSRTLHALYRKGRTVIFLSHRTAQLRTVKALLLAFGVPEEDVGVLEASMKEAVRAVQLQRRLLLCTYNMADEGLDKKELDTCVMGTPKAKVEQCIGRIQRELEGKRPPIVVDVSDDDSPFYHKLRMARHNFYRRQAYTTHVVPAADFAPDAL